MKSETNYCKKITYTDSIGCKSPKVLLGLILSEDAQFIKFKTAKREHLISKRWLISLEDTDEIFRGAF